MSSAVRLAKSVIKIPKRIERGPTDILKALAGTVKYDPRNPTPLESDDPYLVGDRASLIRLNRLSKLSGIKTARFLMEKHPELFHRDDSEPKIVDLLPKEEFTANMEFAKEDILWCIENNDPINAVVAYSQLKERGVKLENETLLQLLELLCFTNEEEPLHWFDKQTIFLSIDPDRERSPANLAWKPNGTASQLFNLIKEDASPARAYSAMIAGLVRFKDYATSMIVYEDFKANHPDLGLSLEAYNALLVATGIVCPDDKAMRASITDIIHHMSQNSVKPDVLVFNSIFTCLNNRKAARGKDTGDLAIQLLNDMATLEVQPSLFTFAQVVQILYNSNRQLYGDAIASLIESMVANKTILGVKDLRDLTALVQLMRFAVQRLSNLSVAKRIFKLYTSAPHLMSDIRAESRFLNHFMGIVCAADNWTNIAEFYDNYGKCFRPDDDNFDLLADAMELYKVPEDYVKRVAKDIVDYKSASRIKNNHLFMKYPDFKDAFENGDQRRVDRL